MTAFAQVEDATDRVIQQFGAPDEAGPPAPTPEPHDGLTYYWLEASIDWAARPSETSVLLWNGGARVWVETATLDEIKAVMWERIKDKRDSTKRGGVLVNGSWFHSDDSSRIQQLGLVMMGANVPAVQWKTMSGAFVTMSQALAGAIFNAVASLDQNAFANAEQHRAAMAASANPSAYDYSTGWPQVYADTLPPAP
jgi:hypothetical protein